MKPIAIIVLSIAIAFNGCNQIKPPKCNSCDQLKSESSVQSFLEIRITNQYVKCNNVAVAVYSEIDKQVKLVREVRNNCDHCWPEAMLFIDKNCLYGRVDSVFVQLRKSSLHGCFIKVNSLKDSCWLRIHLPPFGYDYCEDFTTIPTAERDSLNLTLLSYKKADSVIVNSDVFALSDLPKMMSKYVGGRYCFVIVPQVENTFEEVLKLREI